MEYVTAVTGDLLEAGVIWWQTSFKINMRPCLQRLSWCSCLLPFAASQPDSSSFISFNFWNKQMLLILFGSGGSMTTMRMLNIWSLWELETLTYIPIRQTCFHFSRLVTAHLYVYPSDSTRNHMTDNWISLYVTIYFIIWWFCCYAFFIFAIHLFKQ